MQNIHWWQKNNLDEIYEQRMSAQYLNGETMGIGKKVTIKHILISVKRNERNLIFNLA